MTWDWSFAVKILPTVLSALGTTLAAALVGFLLALGIGLVFCLLGQSKTWLLRWPTIGLVQFVRNTPLLVQLYFLFFVLPEYGILLSPFATGVFALGLHYATYTSEVYRAGVESIPRAQWEAAIALNLSQIRTWFAVIIPQAIRRIIPALGNYLVSSFKDTPVLSAITLVELLAKAQIIGSVTFRYLEPITLVGTIYLVISLVAVYLVRLLAVRFAPHG